MHVHLHNRNLALSDDTLYYLSTCSIVIAVVVVNLQELVTIPHDIVLFLIDE